MEGSVESAGQFATGVAVASGIDSPEAERPGEGDHCLNCGAPVAASYCANCGQKTHLHRTIGEAVHEMVHGVLHFDTKLWRTLPLLAFKPGFLTRDYIEGRRVRYISPVALFLMTIFLTYIVFSSINPRVPDDAVVVDGNLALTQEASQDVATARANLERDLAAARTDPARAGEVEKLERMLKGVDAVARTMERPDGGFSVGPENLSAVIREAQANDLLRVDLGGNKALEDKANAALANPDLVLYKMQQKGYKLAFLLVPLSLPWIWLLFFWRKDLHGYDHVVFLLYSISFMFMLAVTAALLLQLNVTSGWVYGLLLIGYPLAHLFLQLKGAYGLSTGGALWRTGFLSFAAVVTLSLYFVLILLLGLLD
jgi:hypothetical protein